MKIVRIIIKIMTVFMFAVSIYDIVCHYNVTKEHTKLLKLKEEYQKLDKDITYYYEIKNNYTVILDEKKSLNEKKEEVENKINDLNNDIDKLKNNISSTNKNIDSIS